MGRLDGKVALITGGARGMGKAHARHFVAEGARVVIGDVLEEKGRRVADEIGGVFVRHDVTSADDWAAAVSLALETYQKIDILVNNAGILRHGPVAEMDPDEFRHVIDVNLVGSWLGIRQVVPPMRAAGGGSIVNISSIEGIAGAAGLSAYSASKFGVRGLTRSAAQELGPLGIRVNSVHPGGVMTSMALAAAQTMTGVDGSGFLKALPIARFAEPVEISRLVAFLASDEASYTTGAEFLADGGLLSGPGY
ncbi:3alpha(or 20beta)-hydroxysteroid dehydrogenase [Actinoplanes lutulentus]|uniref:3alpha(Or 20beta)-hydroxysteroid dehydrogenase n=1 Tax=Actinoplanes lutulentus TaxID=1287878 RepID=A0A327ZK39_9ACTN|nr:glucose 1-dehydrogenase [Actinoplanes lutulentus]MBB2940998.1 3alpha(or 20beta)-hydroxysteroid dehydrogenase [Actinoplanes lutulentus]RAK43307.1 3alpha(or 20beta)-hydroxysteroid dehydrogenase [Actinoplanes lutulentus]